MYYKIVHFVWQNKLEYWTHSNYQGWKQYPNFDELYPGIAEYIEIHCTDEQYNSRKWGMIVW